MQDQHAALESYSCVGGINRRCLMPQSQTPMMCQCQRTGECKGRVVGTELEFASFFFVGVILTLWHLQL